MFSVLADEGSVATGSTLLFAAAAFCACAARPAVERHRAAVARLTARNIFAILDLLRACSPFPLKYRSAGEHEMRFTFPLSLARFLRRGDHAEQQNDKCKEK